MNLKEYFKQKLTTLLPEDLGSPELMANIQHAYDSGDNPRDPYDKKYKIAASPYLYIPDPNNPTKPMRVPGARLHPRLTFALSSAAQYGSGIPEEDVKIIKDFIKQHGHFVGAEDLHYPQTFQTNDPSSVLSNVFGSTRKRR